MKSDVRILDGICIVGLLVLLLGGGVVAVGSARARASRVGKQNASLDRCTAQLAQADSVLQLLSQVVAANQSALDTLRERLPESDGMGSLLSSLDSVAQRSGVQLQSVTPGHMQSEDLCHKTAVQFECVGDFRSLHQVLYAVESLPRLVRINRVSVRRASLHHPCRMDVGCSVYSR